MGEVFGLMWLVAGGILWAAGKEFLIVVLCFGFASLLLTIHQFKQDVKDTLEDWEE